MPYSRANGTDIWFEVKGDGPALVLIHANPFDHDLWLYQSAHFSTWFKIVADRHPRLWPLGQDQRAVLAQGHMRRRAGRDGRSRHCARDRHGVQRGIGHRHRLGPRSSRPVRGPHPRRRQQRRQRPLHEARRRLSRESRATTTSSICASSWRPRSPSRGSGVICSRCSSSANRGSTAKPLRKCSAPATARTARRRLPEMKVPTLVINGEFDHSLAAGRRTASLAPGAEHRILEGTGHACCIEDPPGFDNLVIAFLRSRGLMPSIA